MSRPAHIGPGDPNAPIEPLRELGDAIVEEMKAREKAYRLPRQARAVAKAQKRVAELAAGPARLRH